jgi:hypothetical protein
LATKTIIVEVIDISVYFPANFETMKLRIARLTFLILLASTAVFAVAPPQEFYELRIYHLKTDAQEKTVDAFLKEALLPALHKQGLKSIGVFKPIEQDTADRKIYVMIPYSSLKDFTSVNESIANDKNFVSNGSDYLNAKFDNPPYARMESILLKAFSHNPVLTLPELKGPRESRVYELRSYEGHSENIFRNKVHMFNEGGEVALFKRLGFNAVFYAEVIAGPRMPNLMYMTTFDSKESRDEHWKSFGNDPEWKKLSSMPMYQKNVSKIDIYFLRPTSYSDY